MSERTKDQETQRLVFCRLRTAALLLLVVMGAAACTREAKDGERADDVPVIRVLVTTHAWTKDMEDIPSYRELSEKTGIRVEWEQVRSGWEDRKTAVLSSGAVPDVFLGGAITDEDIAAWQDLLLPMDEYLPDCPNIQKMFNDKPDTKMLASFTDGSIYGLPSVKFHRPDSTSILMINQEWLDTLGLETPKTFEEFRIVLRAFRDEDPNRNGMTDEIPFDFANGTGLFTAMNLIGAYGAAADDYSGDWFGMKNGQVLFLPVTDEYRQLVRYLNSLFQEELINQEVFSQDYSQFQLRAKESEAMRVGATIGWSIEDRVGPEYAGSYSLLLPLAAKEGIMPYWPSNPARCKYEVNRVVLTKANRYPEETMRWIDAMYGEEFSVQAIYGSFGIGVECTENGYEVLPASDGKTADEWKWINSLAGNAVCYASDELDRRLKPPASIELRLQQDELYRPYFQPSSDILPRLKFPGEDAGKLAVIKPQILKLANEKWVEWITAKDGEHSVDAQWVEYLEEMKEAGLEEMLSIYEDGLKRCLDGRHL